MKKEFQEYLGRITQGLAAVSERSIQRRVTIQGEEHDALTALLVRSPLLLLGDPGSGKTTQLEMTAFAAARAQGARELVPFLLRASTSFRRTVQTDLATWLSQAAAFDPPSALVRQVVGAGSALILIDGLDELRPDVRGEAIHRLRRWIVEHSANHWVLSSRPIGRPAFPELAIEAVLLGLSSDEVSRAARLFFEDEKVADQLKDVVAGHPDLASLATSPLLLGLLAQIFRDQGRLPVARADLYGSWVDIALRQWDKTRGIRRRSDFLSLELTRRALGRLALRLIQSSRATFELSDWFEALRGLVDIDDDKWQSAELTFRENLLGSGLVRTTGPTEFAFPHLTVQEYFASQALLYEEPGDALRIIDALPFEGVAAFYAEVAPDPVQAARFFASSGRFDDVRRLLDAFPTVGRPEREEIVLLIAQRLGIDHLSFPTASDRQPSDQRQSLRMLWQTCGEGESPNERGRAFEEFAVALFSEVFKVVDVRRLTSFGEVDLICEVKADSFWIRWPGDCFVECKNLQDSVSVAVANEFVGKCSTVRVGLAFLVCAGRFTGPARERMSRSWSQAEGPDMAWVDGGDIEEWLSGTLDTESFLKNMVRRASYGAH